MNVIHGLKFPHSRGTQIPYFGVNGTCLVLHHQIAVFLAVLSQGNLLVFTQVHICNVHTFPEGVNISHALFSSSFYFINLLINPFITLSIKPLTTTQPGVNAAWPLCLTSYISLLPLPPGSDCLMAQSLRTSSRYLAPTVTVNSISLYSSLPFLRTATLILSPACKPSTWFWKSFRLPTFSPFIQVMMSPGCMPALYAGPSVTADIT